MSWRIDWINARYNTSRSGEHQDFYEPNAGLAPELVEQGVSLSESAFLEARVEPQPLTISGVRQPGFLLGTAGGIRHLVYVRVTVEEEAEEGTGPVPGLLIDTARELKAEPHVVRVHLHRNGAGTAIEYYGHDELERALKESGNHWHRILLGRRTVRDCLRLAGLSRLEVKVIEDPPGEREAKPPAPEDPLYKILEEIYNTEPKTYYFPGHVSVALGIDPPRTLPFGYSVSLAALVESALCSDEYYIFTCHCGSPGCAGLHRGVQVVHEEGLVVWWVRGIRPRRLVVFDKEQYCREVLTKARQALQRHAAMGPKAILSTSDDPAWMQRMLDRVARAWAE